MHECSHQDVASFLGLSVTTVNNRLHAARSRLKERMLTMVTETLHSRALPDDFANRIGRLITARGGVVEALFDPNSPPDILTELAVSDEANRRAVAVQVVQRPGGGVVRGVAMSPIDAVPRGSTVMSSGRQSETPVNLDELERILPALVGPSPIATGAGRFLETGIKVIDVMCPLVAGGNVVIAGERGTGIAAVMYELTQRLKGGPDRLKIFTLMPLWPDSPPGWSIAAELKKEGYSDIPEGAVETFFFRTENEPWTESRLSALDPFDVVIHLSRERGRAMVYPTLDVLTSRSRLLQTKAVGDEHVAIATRVRRALAALWSADGHLKSGTDHATPRARLEAAELFHAAVLCRGTLYETSWRDRPCRRSAAHLLRNPRRAPRRPARRRVLFQRRNGGNPRKYRAEAQLRSGHDLARAPLIRNRHGRALSRLSRRWRPCAHLIEVAGSSLPMTSLGGPQPSPHPAGSRPLALYTAAAAGAVRNLISARAGSDWLAFVPTAVANEVVSWISFGNGPTSSAPV